MLARHGQPEAALDMLGQALAHAQTGDRFQLEWTLSQVGQVEWLLGRYRESRLHQIDSLRMNAAARNLPGIQANVSSIAALESQEGRHVEAVHLLGMSATLSSRTGALAPPIFTQAAQIEADARTAIGDEAVDRELAAGAAMTLEETVAYVERLPAGPGPRVDSASSGATSDQR
jgi:hypothetical protein